MFGRAEFWAGESVRDIFEWKAMCHDGMGNHEEAKRLRKDAKEKFGSS